MSEVKLGYVILYVDDLDRALRFYDEGVGLKQKARHGQYAELDTGGTVLGLSERSFVEEHLTGKLPAPGQGSSELGIVVARDEVKTRYDRAIAAGATAVKEPEEQPWGQLVSYVRDPDGHLLEICSPV